MFVVDTNILIYAADEASPHHRQARSLIEDYLNRTEPWAVTWSILYEFMRVATHPAVFETPWSTQEACEFVSILLDAPALIVLQEGTHHIQILNRLLKDHSDVRGSLLHDAHIAALMQEHGIRQIQTLDKDFDRFTGVERTDPLI